MKSRVFRQTMVRPQDPNREPPRQRLGQLALLILLSLSVCGMTMRKAGEIPTPKENYHVRITDRLGIQTLISQVSIEGDLCLSGARGEGKLFIPFEKVLSATFGEITGKGIASEVHLRDGQSVSVTVEKELRCYGDTPFGHYSIPLEKIREIEIVETPAAATPAATAAPAASIRK